MTLVARRREHFWIFLAIFLVAQLPPKRGVLVHKNSLVLVDGVVTALGCDQQNMEKILSDFKWVRHRSAYIFANGWSTGSHKRKVTLLEAPTGTFLFYYKDIKQEIVHTLLLEEYAVSKKWVIIMDSRQDLNVTSTPAGKSGPSAQDRYCARGLGGGAKKRRANEK